MKRAVIFLFVAFILGIANAQANTHPIKKSIIVGNKGKKTTKAIKSNNKNSFVLWSNPYKLSTFCRLIQLGNYNAVKTLIENGADVNKESNKLTPLMFAARHNRPEIAKLLIENGANLKAKSSKGYTALQWAKMVNAKEAYFIIETALKNKKK